MILVYVTHKNHQEAESMTKALFEQKLIACVNIFPIESCYFLGGKIDERGEVVSLFKTKEDLWPEVRKAIKELHSYKIPCILKLEVEANEEYLEWLNEQLV